MRINRQRWTAPAGHPSTWPADVRNQVIERMQHLQRCGYGVNEIAREMDTTATLVTHVLHILVPFRDAGFTTPSYCSTCHQRPVYMSTGRCDVCLRKDLADRAENYAASYVDSLMSRREFLDRLAALDTEAQRYHIYDFRAVTTAGDWIVDTHPNCSTCRIRPAAARAGGNCPRCEQAELLQSLQNNLDRYMRGYMDAHQLRHFIDVIENRARDFGIAWDSTALIREWFQKHAPPPAATGKTTQLHPPAATGVTVQLRTLSTCPSCGSNDIPDQSVFCIQCGTQLVDKPKQA